MTGEEMIVCAAAKLLREAKFDEHMELRKVFWIAGRCEHCGSTYPQDGNLRCSNCERPIINRSSSDATADSR